MKGFAVSLIIAAFAIGGSSTDELINEEPRYLLELKNNEGSNVGKLAYYVHEDYAAFVYGTLPGLKPGTYYGIAYKDQNFNGTCASSDPFEQMTKNPEHISIREAFRRVDISNPFYSVMSYVRGLYLGCDTKNSRDGLLTYVYLMPKGVAVQDFMSLENPVRPSPAACGYIKLHTPCRA